MGLLGSERRDIVGGLVGWFGGRGVWRLLVLFVCLFKRRVEWIGLGVGRRLRCMFIVMSIVVC